jgi:hypothetical protein
VSEGVGGRGVGSEGIGKECVGEECVGEECVGEECVGEYKGRYLLCDPDPRPGLQSRLESEFLLYVLSRVRLGIISITTKDKSFAKAQVKADR